MLASDRPRPHRLAQLGGTTDLGDCALAVRALVRPRAAVQGPEVEEFERATAQRAGVRHGIAFATGRLGLWSILAAAHIGRGDEVLLGLPSHVVVANAIRYLGARPVFVDCDAGTLGLDVADADRRITSRAKALVVQHSFGVPARLDELGALADAHGIELIEDAVHALGARWAGRDVGSFGRAGFFSTEETKMISTTLGGMVVTDDDDLASSIRQWQGRCEWPAPSMVARRAAKLLGYHALTWPPVHRHTRAVYEALGHRQPLPTPVSSTEARGEVPQGYWQRLSAAQAAIGLRQLARLDDNLHHRRQVARRYQEVLGSDRVFDVLGPSQPSWVRFPVVVRDRRAAAAAVADHAVLGTWFTSVLEEADRLDAVGYAPGNCPVAERLSAHLVNLPTHPRVSIDAAEALAEAIAPWCTDPRALR